MNERKQELIVRFQTLFPEYSPSYHEVMSIDPVFFQELMTKFGGYRSFLRRIHRKFPKPTKKEAAFIRYSSRVSRNYFINCWSSLEELTFAFLTMLDEDHGFIHNFPFPSPKSLFKLDFFNPCIQKRIEVDGIYHTAIPYQKEKDRLKDEYLAQFGIETLHLNSQDFKDWSSCLSKLKDFIGEDSI